MPGAAFPASSNEAWQARQAAATSRGVGVLSSFYAARGRNAELWDIEGRRYRARAVPRRDRARAVPQRLARRDREAALDAVRGIFRSTIEARRVAAFIFEPVQGEGGFVPAPTAFIAGLRRIADEHGILLIADEVQTGFARTGKLFASSHHAIPIDLMTFAKSLAAGLPLSGVCGRAGLMDASQPGGPGSMVAAEFCYPAIHAPAPEFAKRVQALALQRGLLLLTCGLHGNVIRFLHPLTTPDDVFDEALDILEHALLAARCSQPTPCPLPFPIRPARSR